MTDNLPNATPGDILGKKAIIRKDQPILPASLPYKVIVAGTESSVIPEQLKHKITIQLADANNPSSAVITYTASLPQLAGKRLTVSYDPATTDDQTTINRYQEEYATSIPAYLIHFVPVLKIEGEVVATGPAVGMGSSQNLTVTITSPLATEQVTHNLLAGDYTAIGLNPSKISLDALQNRIDKNDYSEPVGEMLHQVALSYWGEADAFNNVIAKTMRVNNLRHPSELAASAKVSVSYVWDVPTSATYASSTLDVKLDNQSVATKSADKTKEFYYMQQSGANSSFLEGAIYDQLFGANIGDGISAITALKLANEQGIPIYKIDSSNIASVLPKLSVSDTVKTDVSNVVNAGMKVQIPQMNIAKAGWTGVGYIILNKTDGSSAYRISGGLNESDNSTEIATVSPIPIEAISTAATFVIGTLASNSGLVLKASGGYFTGFAVAPEVAAGIAIGAIEAAAFILIMVLIVAIVIAIYEKLPQRFEPYRKYTPTYWAMKDWVDREIGTGDDGWLSGDLLFPGIYITDLTIEPTTLNDRINIATILRIPRKGTPDPNAVTAYIDILIDKNRVGLISCQFIYPHQFLYPHIPLKEDGVKIKFVAIGPSVSQ